jgi:hypothetical protein
LGKWQAKRKFITATSGDMTAGDKQVHPAE